MSTITTFKSKFGKQVLSVAFLGIFLSFGFNVLAQKADFSGTWNFNEGKSQLGEGRFRAAASKLVLSQSDSVLNLERSGKGMGGNDYQIKEKYTFDGKVSENKGMMNTVKKSTLAWSTDNKTLTINSTSVFERDGNSMEIRMVEAFSISSDGKTLTVNSTSTSQRGERKQTLVYDKAASDSK